MFTIAKREFSSFFSSPIGYLVIAVFLLLNGLFLWVFEGEFNILNAGFADLSPYFTLAPWVLTFLIPAVTMRSFSEEKRTGTIEHLLTKPITLNSIVFGKFLGVVGLIVLAVLPTLLYLLTISSLKTDLSVIDLGSIAGSFIGLFCLILGFASIGTCCSALTNNQIVAFIAGVLGCFLCYFGFEGFANSGIFSSANDLISALGMKARFEDMGRGVLDLGHVVYFVVVVLLFTTITRWVLTQNKNRKLKALAFHWAPVVVLIAVFAITSQHYARLDLTKDQRYTLSEASKEVVSKLDSPLVISVFLEGEFPSEFKRLQAETKQLLREFKAVDSRIVFEFVNPLEDEPNPDQVQQQLAQLGILPARATVRDGGQTNQVLVYPWALANYKDKSVKIPLLKNQLGTDTQQRVLNSIQNLEYAFSDGFGKLLNPKRNRVAVLKGNGELDDLYIADLLKSMRDYYFIAPFTLDSVSSNPLNTIKELKQYDLVIAAKPTESFSDQEKYVLDQYHMSGGNSLWLVDAVTMETDSLFATGQTLAYPRDLNLTDFFFKYGVRINSNLVTDVYSAPIVLASGQERDTQYERYPWFYSPLTASGLEHPITTNIEAVRFEYASGIDTLDNGIDKKVLLSSSAITKLRGVPQIVSLEEIEFFIQVTEKGPTPTLFPDKEIPLAVLMEGAFTSVYKNRVKPYNYSGHKDEGELAKIVVVSDGDLIKNQVQGNRPLELGFDKWTSNFYGNKEFLMNTVNYLLDDTGLINIRSKEIAVAFLDPQKSVEQRTKWQAINLLFPLALLGIFGLGYTLIRKKRYAG